MILSVPKFQHLILSHYQEDGRKNLLWKKTRDPYKILVSEVMLQQTQVSRVLPKYKEFLKAFPNVKALAKAPDAKLLKVWQGLGYWRRTKYLKAAAQAVIRDYKGKFPHNPKDLESLPGIGPYTARAVACFAFGACEPFIDTNIRRVYLHFFFPNQKNVRDEKILEIAQRALYKKDPRLWHYALFDYGATVLKDKKINRRSHHYTKQSQFTGSFRSLRTSVVQLLLEQPRHHVTSTKIVRFLKQKIQQNKNSYTPDQVIQALWKDKLIKETQSGFKL